MKKTMKNKSLLSEVRQFQKIAGILKEYIESDPESITEAFQKAGIDLSQPVTYILDYGAPGGTDRPKTVQAGELLRKLEAERQENEQGSSDYNQQEGITYEFNPKQGAGELLGDKTLGAQGLTCKLVVNFSDSHGYEIWQ